MAAVDLLPEIKAGAIDPGTIAVDVPPEYDEPQTGTGLNAFYDVVVKVNQQIQNMKRWTTELGSIHNELHCCTDDAQKTQLRSQSAELHDQISAESKSIKDNLDSMQKITAECKKKENQHPAEVRIQENQHMLLRQEFVAALTSFQQVEQSNKDKYKETIKRRIKTKFSQQNLPDEDVEKMAKDVIDNGKESAIFSSNKMAIATTVLEEVVEMRKDIHKIEVALKELHQIFLDMAVLVAEQGELMNDIRDNVNKATNYIFEGRVQVKKAREHQKTTRRRMCYLFVCVVVIVVIALIVGFAALS
ncbi:Syntaxin-124 [Diplonema papillatum]|nr:Syntaxin-124 [Diplonema papillatum]